jgi:hypothetical protein
VNNEKRLPGTEIAAHEKQKDRIQAGSAMALPFYLKLAKGAPRLEDFLLTVA